MDAQLQLTYPAPPADVVAMLCDQGFVETRAKEQGSLTYSVTISAAGPKTSVTLARSMPPVVPDFVKRFIGETVEVNQTDIWTTTPTADGGYTGTLTAKIPGTPVTISGTMSVTPDGQGGSVQSVNSVVKAPIPLVGGKIEKAIVDLVRMAAGKEQEVGRAWLAQR